MNETSKLGGSFFLQIPSVDWLSNTSVLYKPPEHVYWNTIFFTYIIRIYTNQQSLGRIQLNNKIISVELYRQIQQSDFYYYENETSNSTQRVSGLDENAVYSVSFLTVEIR